MVAKSFEDLLTLVGEFGRWQWRIFALFVFVRFLLDYQFSNYIFNAAIPDFSCDLHRVFNPDNWTSTEKKDFMLPRVDVGGVETWSSCKYYSRNYSRFTNMSYDEAASESMQDPEPETASCISWNYDEDGGVDTAVEEWNLVCDRISLRPSLQSVFMFGALVGSLVAGIISDRLGRKKSLTLCIMVMTCSTWAEAYAPNYVTYLVFRFFTGFGATGMNNASYVIMVEIVGKSKRAQTAFSLGILQSFARIVWSGIAFVVVNWRDYTFIAACASTLLLITIGVLVPESPRWLMMKKRYEEAARVMHHAAEVNHQMWPEEEEMEQLMINIHESEQEIAGQEEKTKSNYEQLLTLIKSSEIRSRCLRLYSTWFVCALITHGALYLSARIKMDIHVMMATSGVSSIIAISTAMPVINRFGRKFVLATCLFISSPLVASIAIIPSEPVWTSWLLLQLSRMGSVIAYSVSQLLSSELFPTDIRTVAVGLGMVCTRVAAILAPFAVDLLGTDYVIIPSAIFGVMSLLAGVIALFMPETRKENLPDKIIDIRKKIHNGAIGLSLDDGSKRGIQ